LGAIAGVGAIAAPTRCHPIYVAGVAASTRYHPIYVAGVVGVAGALQALQLLRAIIPCTFKPSHIPSVHLQKFSNENFSRYRYYYYFAVL